ncbi:MAG: hypothetical protein KKB34_10335 [Bacteroidetes bacterium]|nr:hypothetical protein [Bacteroidota bacterium]
MTIKQFNEHYTIGDEVICTDAGGVNFTDTLESYAYQIGYMPVVQLRRNGTMDLSVVVCKYNPLDYGEAGGSSEIYGGH